MTPNERKIRRMITRAVANWAKPPIFRQFFAVQWRPEVIVRYRAKSPSPRPRRGLRTGDFISRYWSARYEVWAIRENSRRESIAEYQGLMNEWHEGHK